MSCDAHKCWWQIKPGLVAQPTQSQNAASNNITINRNNHKIDGAIIATPPNTHFKVAKQCLTNNIHVLVEKPMVESLKELDELNNLSKNNNKLLMSGHTYLYNSAIIKMKEIIEDNQIGDIMFIHSQRLNFGIMREETDVFLSLAPHDISLVQFFIRTELN